MDELVCRECNALFKNRCFLKKHLRKVHALNYKEYVIKHDYSGIHPTCACGCGTEVGWYNDIRFYRLIKGHFTQEMRDAQSKRRKGIRETREMRERKSQIAKAFFSSDEGKRIAAARAVKLNEFHASDRGIQWSHEQSERLRAFNATGEGKEIRADVGKKVSEFYKNNPDAREQQRLNVCAWYDSEEGRAFVARNTEHLRKFYKTSDGKQVIAEMIPKIRDAVMLSKSKFDERIANAFSGMLEPLSAIPSYDEYDGWRETLDRDFTVRCRTCGFEHTRNLMHIVNIPKCLRCTATLTKPQIELSECIRDMGYNVVLNERSVIAPKEIDVWIPSHRVAVEYNGLYWHCKDNRAELHVEEKMDVCSKQGIRLIIVFEDEWRDRRHAVLANIQVALCAQDNAKCDVIDVCDDDRRKFFDAFHMIGDAQCLFSLGAQANGNTVAMMSFNVCDDVASVARYAVHPTFRTKNVAYLLVNTALKRYRSVSAKLDPRYCDIEEFNFADVVTTTPMFWWTDFVYRSNDQTTFMNRPNVKQIFGAHERLCVFHRK